MEQITSFLRFSVPSLFSLVFIITAEPDFFFDRLKANILTSDTSISLIGILLGTSGLVIVFGFLISSITSVFVNFSGLRATGSPKFPGLFKYYKDRMTDDECELEIWRAQKPEHVHKQVGNRWNLVMANMNALVALIVSVVVLIVFCEYFHEIPGIFKISLIWWLIWSSCIFIFGYNCWAGYRSVRNINQKLTKSKSK